MPEGRYKVAMDQTTNKMIYMQGVGEDWLTTSDCVLHGDWVTTMGGQKKKEWWARLQGVQEAEEAKD